MVAVAGRPAGGLPRPAVYRLSYHGARPVYTRQVAIKPGVPLSNDCVLNQLSVTQYGVCENLRRWKLVGNRSTRSPTGLYYRGRQILDATVRALQLLGMTSVRDRHWWRRRSAWVYLQADYWLSQTEPKASTKVARWPTVASFKTEE